MQFISSDKIPTTIEDLNINYNSEGWGPMSGVGLEQYRSVPYSHFDKKEKYGRPADFITNNNINLTNTNLNPKQLYHQKRKEMNLLYNNFNFKHDTNEDNTFQLVDTAKAPSKYKHVNKRNQQQQKHQIQNTSANRLAGRTNQQYNRENANQLMLRNNIRHKNIMRKNYRTKQDRVASLEVEGDWKVIEEFDLQQLLKLAANIPKVEDLLWCGHVDQYDDTFDKISTRAPRTLCPVENKIFYDVTSGEDPILEKFAIDGMGDVYATDTILARLMASPRSVYSWDIIIEKINNIIFLDKRDNSNFDLLTVSESAGEPPIATDDVEECNHPENLSIEATRINQNFSQQILMYNSNEGERKNFEKNPFFDPEVDAEDGSEPASVAYRYRRFNLGSIRLVARCEVHSWTNKRNEDQYITCHALHEWDNKHGVANWRQKMEQQRGAVLATELKNNSCRLSRWAAQSLLSGADLMKLGYISRVAPTNNLEHQVLATQFFKPKDFAQQMNLNLTNIWGIIKMICELLMTKEDGKYVMLKDPNKPTLRLYSVPLDTFEEDEESDENDADED